MDIAIMYLHIVFLLENFKMDLLQRRCVQITH